MENNVLGLKIAKVSEGDADILTVNGQDYWCRYKRDIRTDLNNIEISDAKSPVVFISGIGKSILLTVVSCIGGRLGDYISAWINIPGNIRISGQELANIVESVRKELMKNMRDDEALKELFSKEYDTEPLQKPLFESSGDKVAYRLYGRGQNYNLAELLDKMNQPYYQGYKCVFFIDSESSARIKVGDDLSGRKLLSQVRIDPPRRTDDGFAPYINGHQFTSPVYVMEDDKFEVVWKRPGYKDIVHTHDAKAELYYPVRSEYRRLISYRNFVVMDEKGNPVPEYRLFINGSELKEGAEMPVSEVAVAEGRVRISAEGYEEYDEKRDLSHQCMIRLKKETYKYEFEIPAESGTVSFEYSSEMPLRHSPIKGYVPKDSRIYKNGPNELKYSPYDKKFWITALVAALVVLCAGIAIGMFLPDMNKSETNDEKQNVVIEDRRELEQEPKEDKIDEALETSTGKESSAKSAVDRMVEYLDENNVWNRNDMQKLGYGRLWDALNNRNFAEIRSYRNELKDSERFERVLNAVERNSTKDFQPFNKGNKDDFDITIDPVEGNKGYIKCLDDANSGKSAAKTEQKKSSDKKEQNTKTETKPESTSKKSQDNWSGPQN